MKESTGISFTFYPNSKNSNSNHEATEALSLFSRNFHVRLRSIYMTKKRTTPFFWNTIKQIYCAFTKVRKHMY